MRRGRGGMEAMPREGRRWDGMVEERTEEEGEKGDDKRDHDGPARMGRCKDGGAERSGRKQRIWRGVGKDRTGGGRCHKKNGRTGPDTKEWKETRSSAHPTPRPRSATSPTARPRAAPSSGAIIPQRQHQLQRASVSWIRDKRKRTGPPTCLGLPSRSPRSNLG
jgi:hypothetical protein